MRTGLITEKLGMTQVFNASGERIPVTLLKFETSQVVSIKTPEKDGYLAVQVGYGQKKLNSLTKPLKGHFAKNKVEPKRKLVEFRISQDALLNVGDELTPEHFVVGQKVDVTSNSIGKGYAGVMKRHNFGGLRASHGVSISHRSGGSIGQCQDPGKVDKGKKMAGRLGNERVTIQNLEIIKTDSENGLIYVKGAIPGHKGSYVLLRDAVKVARPESAPFPAGLKGGKPAVAQDENPVTAQEETSVTAQDEKPVVNQEVVEENIVNNEDAS